MNSLYIPYTFNTVKSKVSGGRKTRRSRRSKSRGGDYKHKKSRKSPRRRYHPIRKAKGPFKSKRTKRNRSKVPSKGR